MNTLRMQLAPIREALIKKNSKKVCTATPEGRVVIKHSNKLRKVVLKPTIVPEPEPSEEYIHSRVKKWQLRANTCLLITKALKMAGFGQPIRFTPNEIKNFRLSKFVGKGTKVHHISPFV